MTIIWQRKKNLILALIIGALMAGIPMGIILALNNAEYKKCKENLVSVKEQQGVNNKKKVLVLANDLFKGDLISDNDLIEYDIYCDDGVDMSLAFEDVKGKSIKINANKGTILNSDMVCDTEKIADDIRLHMYSDIELHSGIMEGSIVDIRITFPNGEDYVVAEHKRIESRVENNILVKVSESEILKLASANVDKNIYEGARIYAILYVADYQEPAKSDYPVNSSVIELGTWNPNLIERIFTEEMVNNRNVLESNLNEFMTYRNS